MLEGDEAAEALKIDNPPAPVLMVGLQGSGKTTTTAKLARRLKDREGKRVLMASLDTNRPRRNGTIGNPWHPDRGRHAAPLSKASRRLILPSAPSNRPLWAAMTCICWIPRAACILTMC